MRHLSTAADAGSPWVSLSCVVHGGKNRLIMDLRLINRCMHARRFKHQRLTGFLSSLVPYERLFSWDVRGSFDHIPCTQPTGGTSASLGVER